MGNELCATQSSILSGCLDRFSDFGFTATVQRIESEATTVRVEGKRGGKILRLTEHEDLTVTGLLREGAELSDRETIRLGYWISPKAADALRTSHVNYLDTAGNAFIAIDDWYIDVRGRRSDRQEHETPSTRSPRNAFSTRRAQVVFAVLQWEGLHEADVRTIAHVAGTSVGLAHRTLTELREQPELWPSTRDGRENLLTAWLAAYPTGLGAAHHLGRFRSDDVTHFYGDVCVSGDSAVPLLIKPTEAIVYVDELSSALVVSNRWSLDQRGNVEVKRRFWRDPERDPHDESARAPRLLIIADLASSEDARRREVADVLRATDAW